MHFLLGNVSFGSVFHALLYFAVFSALPTAIAWILCIRLCRRSDRPVPLSLAFFSVFGSFLICGVTLSWSTQGRNYSVFQVVLSAILTVLLTVLLVYRSHPRNAVSIIVIWGVVWGYSLGWSVIAGSSDFTGLWGAGLLFLCLGLTWGLSLVVIIVQIIAVHRESSQRPSSASSTS